MGTKRSILTDEKGLPLSVVLSGANTHDIKLLEETLDSIIISRPAVTQNLCLDAGYTAAPNPLRSVSTLPISVPEVKSAKK
nr:transposase [uncultured Oscillibacter sp.]